MAPSGPPVKKGAAAAAEAAPKAKGEKKPKVEKKEDEEEKVKVAQPDRAAFDEKLEKVQAAIDGLQKKQAECTKKVHERSGGKDEFFVKKNELRAQLDEFSGKMNELQARRDGLKKAVDAKRQEGQDMKAELGKMKKSVGYTNVADIEERIATIEFKLWTDTISLKEEKAYILEIAALKKSKPKVNELHKMEENIGAFDPNMNSREQVAVINEEMAKYREGKKKISEKLTELMEGRKAQLGDMPDIIAERDEISKKIQEKIKERNDVRDEFRVAEREYNAHLAEARKARQEKSIAERAERDKEYNQRRLEREAEKLDDQPHVAEITLIEQTIFWCDSFKPKTEEKKVETKKEIASMDGCEMVVKREDREEYYYAPTAKGKKGKAKKAQDAGDGKGKPIKHNAETFRLFDQLKLDAPITTEDLPAIVEKLTVQLAEYNEKVKVWEVKREEMKRAILAGESLKEEAKEVAKEEEKEEEKKEE